MTGCDVVTGRGRACKNNMAGIKAIYLANYGTLGVVVYDITDVDAITTLTGIPTGTPIPPEFFKYELKDNVNTLVETPSQSNGSSFITQVLSVTLPKLTKSMHKEFKLILWGSPHVIVENQNGEFFMMGIENGCDMTGGSITTGGAKGDLAGYTLVLTAEEKLPANFLVDTIESTTATVSAVLETP